MNLVLFLFLWVLEGKTLLGSFHRSNTQWALLGRFCYDTSGGTVALRAIPDPSLPNQQFVFYEDRNFDFWRHYGKGTSCKHKLKGKERHSIKLNNPLINRTSDYAAVHVPIGGIIPKGTAWPSPENSNLSSYKWIPKTIKSDHWFYPILGSGRRWWYLVVANCEGEDIAIQDYEIIFLNKGDRFTMHFSGPEHGIFETLIGALVLTIILLILVFISYMQQRNISKELDWLILELFMAILITFISIVIQIAHRDEYSRNGIGLPDGDNFCQFLDLVPQIMLVWIFLNVSKGWVISNRPIRDKRSSKEIIFVYFWCQVAIIWWAMDTYDPAVESYIYDSPPGWILSILHVIMSIWFLAELYSTWTRMSETDPEKRTFLFLFGMFGAYWFMFIPITIGIASEMDPIDRKRMVKIIELTSTLLAYTIIWLSFGRNKQKRYDGVANTEMNYLARDTGSMDHDEDDDSIDNAETNI